MSTSGCFTLTGARCLGVTLISALVVAAGGCGPETITLIEGDVVGGEATQEPAAEAVSEPPPSAPPEPPEVDAPNGGFGDLGTTAELPEPGCRKIDFLFVVDNSLSMLDEQAALVQSFPRFLEVVEQTVGVDDFHIMVVDTDGEPVAAGGAPACEDGLGVSSSRSREDNCGIDTGAPFLAAGQAASAEAFACMADVGIVGDSDERPVEAMLAAVSEAANAEEGCNAGFLREDAILVVTLITDEDDEESEGDPSDWERALLAIKENRDDSVVMLGLLGDNNLDGGICSFLGADAAPRLQELATSLGGIGSVCASDYTPFFERSVGWIDATCEDFVPPVLR